MVLTGVRQRAYRWDRVTWSSRTGSMHGSTKGWPSSRVLDRHGRTRRSGAGSSRTWRERWRSTQWAWSFGCPAPR